jgi:hypothetical protein
VRAAAVSAAGPAVSHLAWTVHARRRIHVSQSGVALVTAMMATFLVLALGSALVLISVTDTTISAHYREAARALLAAEAGLHRAFATLAASDDWTSILTSGGSAFTDGPAAGVRRVAGTVVDLDRETNALRCGRARGCGGDERPGISGERPGRVDDPSWNLFAWGPLGRLVAVDDAGDIYVAVWITVGADGPADDPESEEPEPEPAGPALIRLLARAFGPMGAQRTVEATVVQEWLRTRERTGEAVDAEGRRTRMITWREVR